MFKLLKKSRVFLSFADDLKILRERSGAPLMKCKEALT